MRQNRRVPKVQIINSLPKDKWDKLQVLTTILSLVIAIYSLHLYVHEISKQPDIYASVDSPSPSLGKVVFKFDANSSYSNILEFNFGLQNKGNKNSESLNIVYLIFDKSVNVNIRANPFWSAKRIGNYQSYTYLKNDVVLIKNHSCPN